MYRANAKEEQLKNKIAKDFFNAFDTTRILGNIDFCVCYYEKTLFDSIESIHFLWAEAKRNAKIYEYGFLKQ